MNTDKPILEYQNPQPSFWNKPFSRRTVLWIFVIPFIILALLISIMPVSFSASPERANRVKCASNLRQIGQAIQLYIADQKTLPDQFAKLVTLCDLSTEVFVCPSTKDTPAPTTNPTLMTSQPGHCSYIFLFENQPHAFVQGDVGRILAYENPANHNGEGANVLYVDCSVDWVPKDKMAHILSELNLGHNPPRKPPQSPTTSPTITIHPQGTTP